MPCDLLRERLVDLLDDELAPDERRRVRAHLEECAACRKVYRRLEQGAARFRELRPGRARVPAEPALRRANVGWGRWAAVLAAAVGVALIARGAWLPGSDPAEPEARPMSGTTPPAVAGVSPLDLSAGNESPERRTLLACATPDGCRAADGWLLTDEDL